jgi:ABC-type transport system involved in multi-copper enzyme maturation permease subunit
MFAAWTPDREPLSLATATILHLLNSWTQIVGGFAMLGLLLWLIAYLATRGSLQAVNALARSSLGVLLVVLLGPLGALLLYRLSARRGESQTPLIAILFIGGFVWASFGYLLLLALYLPELTQSASAVPETVPAWRVLAQHILWTAAGASAIFAVLVPMIPDLRRLSLRRIGAIARLSFKEAVRRKVLWVFLALLLVVLFASWFIPNKPEDQVRTYVTVVSVAMAVVMLFLAALIAGFGIPDDIRSQTIHTVLTKPVQRFEIFLGRFLGYTGLMTAALVVVNALALLYVLRNINEEAKEESLKAREAYVGDLTFQNTKDEKKGESVGREWDYRSYIFGKGPNASDPPTAVWSFAEVPSQLKDGDTARLEFTLDIYRTHKGKEEGQGVLGKILVESWRFDADNPVMMERYKSRKKVLEDQGEHDVAGKLAEELGYYELSSVEIKDYHTQFLEVPAGVFRNAAKPPGDADRDRLKELQQQGKGPEPPLRVRVRSESQGQFLGMAKYDLYFRLDREDGSGTGNRLRFCLNFFKGSFGLWLRLCLMIGLAVALSTYLSGLITLISAWILFVLGFFLDFIHEVALGKNVGGGPIESAMRLLNRPGGTPLAAPMDESTPVKVATGIDDVFTWTLRRVLSLIPDVASYSFTDRVAEGVAIPVGDMMMAFVVLLGYALPWAVLAYYLLKWREVASSN